MAVKHCILPELTPQEIHTFWNRIDKTPGFGPAGECWKWSGKPHHSGYGTIAIKRRLYLPHRVAYKLHFGVDPCEQQVCHTCDFRLCCNPDHFFLGTQADNIGDAVSKNRMASGSRNGHVTQAEKTPRGDNHPFHLNPMLCAKGDRNGSRKHPERLKRGAENPASKLNDQIIRDIRSRRIKGEGVQALASEYGISRQSIRHIITRKTWAHID
jgi:hypothetical protein